MIINLDGFVAREQSILGTEEGIGYRDTFDDHRGTHHKGQNCWTDIFHSFNFLYHEFHLTCHSVTFYFMKKDSGMMLWHHNARVNSHQRWVYFHLWCELTSTMNVTEWQVPWNSCYIGIIQLSEFLQQTTKGSSKSDIWRWLIMSIPKPPCPWKKGVQ